MDVADLDPTYTIKSLSVAIRNTSQLIREMAMPTNTDLWCEREALEADLEKLLVTLMGSSEPIESPAQDFSAQNPSRDQSFRSYEYRLTVIEQRYHKQLSGLDGLLGQLRSTSSFLSRELKEYSCAQGDK